MNNLSGLDDIGIVFSSISNLNYGLPSCLVLHGSWIVIIVIGYCTVALGPSISITCSKSMMAIPISFPVITNTTSEKSEMNVAQHHRFPA